MIMIMIMIIIIMCFSWYIDHFLEPNLGATPAQSGPVEHGQRMYSNAPAVRSSSEHKPTKMET